MVELILYSGPHCSLCEDAKALLYSALAYGTYTITEVDVTQSLDTKKAYGLRIPVLKNAQTDSELAWPFDALQIQQLALS